MIAEYTVNLNNKTKEELIMLVKEGLEVIKNQQAKLEVYKDIKELAGTEIKEILNWKHENKKMKAEIENLQNAIATYTAHTVCSDIKQSYKHNEDLEMLYKGCQIEIEKKDMIIDEMVYYLSDFDIDEMCEQCECCIGNGCHADDDVEFKMRCIKEYFKKKVEEI